MNLVHEAIVNDESVTKRDIYYKDVLLFRSQPTVDRVSKLLPIHPNSTLIHVLSSACGRSRCDLPTYAGGSERGAATQFLHVANYPPRVYSALLQKG